MRALTRLQSVRPYLWSAALVLFILVLWIGSSLYITENFHEDNWGIFGDMFGAINALFSGLAFAGVVVALILQRADLKVQQELLKESVRNMSAQTAALQAQLETAREANEIERRRYRMESLPSFQWLRSISNPNRKLCFFKNRGGRFKVGPTAAEGDVQVQFKTHQPGAVVETDEEACIILETGTEKPLPPKFRFAVRCETQTGSVLREFEISDGNENPVPTQGLAELQ